MSENVDIQMGDIIRFARDDRCGTVIDLDYIVPHRARARVMFPDHYEAWYSLHFINKLCEIVRPIRQSVI